VGTTTTEAQPDTEATETTDDATGWHTGEVLSTEPEHRVELTVSYGGASVLGRAPVQLRAVLASGTLPPERDERYDFYETVRGVTGRLVQAMAESDETARKLKGQLDAKMREAITARGELGELHAYLAAILAIMREFGFEAAGTDAELAPDLWLRDALNRRTVEAFDDVQRQLDLAGATLVEVHDNWHRAAEGVPGDDPHASGGLSLHGRIHEALGLADSHPWPDPFALGPADADNPTFPRPVPDEPNGSDVGPVHTFASGDQFGTTDASLATGPHTDTAPFGQPVDTDPEGQPAVEPEPTEQMPAATDTDTGERRPRRSKRGTDDAD
jgi:hypothetical protein